MKRWQIAIGAVGALGALGCAGDVVLHRATGLYAYVAAFTFVASSALGALVLLMVAELAAASWFVVLRRVAEAVSGAIPLLPLAFVPIALGLRELYPWANPPQGLDERARLAIEHARGWMNGPLFVGRAALFIALWIALGEGMRRASLIEDRGQVDRARVRSKALSALGLPVIAFSASFATFDWVMSLVPGWNFNILGLYVLCAGFSSALGVLCVAFHLARQSGRIPRAAGAFHAHALGRMLLMSVCLWAYMAVSQLVIVWSANLPREAGFYVARFHGPFRVLSFGLLVLHFAVPFLLLLNRWLKMQSSAVAAVGVLIVSMHAVDMYWLIGPAAPRGASLWDIAPFALLAALFVGFGCRRFARAPSVPVKAPELPRSLAYRSP